MDLGRIAIGLGIVVVLVPTLAVAWKNGSLPLPEKVPPQVLEAPAMPEPDNGLAVALGDARAGDPVVAKAAGAAPGEHVWFLMGTEAGLNSCTGAFGQNCEGIHDFIIADRVAADDLGQAYLRWVVPRNMSGELYVQVGVVRGPGGAESIMSQLATTALVP